MQRLGKNLGRYNGETIAIEQLQEDAHQSALAAGWTSETFLDAPGKKLRGYHRPSPGSEFNLYFSTGIHGDEPSGPLAILQLLREDQWPKANLWLVPCLNPSGFRLNTRENDEGIDLNRDYRRFRSVEVRAHVQWLDRQPNFLSSIILHEDWEANGFYIYESNPENRPTLAAPIIETLRPEFPIEHAEKVDNWPHKDGIIRPGINPADRPEWAESIYLLVNKTRQTYTFEAPSDFPLEFRVKGHLRAMRSSFELLTEVCQ